MCTVVSYQQSVIEFNAPNASLPVINHRGDVQWVRWGLQHREEHMHLRHGAAVMLNRIGVDWGAARTTPVLLAVDRWLAYDMDNRACWLTVPSTHRMRGLLATHRDDARVYVVTVHITGWMSTWRSRWPRLVPAPNYRDTVHFGGGYPFVEELAPQWVDERQRRA